LNQPSNAGTRVQRMSRAKTRKLLRKNIETMEMNGSKRLKLNERDEKMCCRERSFRVHMCQMDSGCAFNKNISISRRV
jgi:hypothetical protein